MVRSIRTLIVLVILLAGSFAASTNAVAAPVGLTFSGVVSVVTHPSLQAALGIAPGEAMTVEFILDDAAVDSVGNPNLAAVFPQGVLSTHVTIGNDLSLNGGAGVVQATNGPPSFDSYLANSSFLALAPIAGWQPTTLTATLLDLEGDATASAGLLPAPFALWGQSQLELTFFIDGDTTQHGVRMTVQSATPTAVPEPSTFALFGVGAAVLANARRRRRQPTS